MDFHLTINQVAEACFIRVNNANVNTEYICL